jgi:hypothetical protein
MASACRPGRVDGGAAEVDVAKDRVEWQDPSGKPRVKRCYWEQPRRVKAADQR